MKQVRPPSIARYSLGHKISGQELSVPMYPKVARPADGEQYRLRLSKKPNFGDDEEGLHKMRQISRAPNVNVI